MSTTEISPASLKAKTLSEALKKASGSLSAVAARMVTPDKLIKIAVAAAQRTPLLLECSPSSIVRAVIQGAELGLVPGSALNQAYLVPFKNKNTQAWEAQLIISAQGLAELAYRSGMVSFVDVDVVYEGDEFEFSKGLNPELRHVPKGVTSDPAKITHAYIIVALKDGGKVFRVMTRADIERLKQRSPSVRGGSRSPWDTDYAEMARKSVAKNGFKYVPKCIEVARAIALDNAAETEDWTGLDFDAPEARDFIDVEASSEAETSPTVKSVESKIKAKATSIDDAYDGPTVQEGEDQGGLV